MINVCQGAQKRIKAHPFNISPVRKCQSKGRRPHGPSIPERPPTIKLISGWLIYITQLGRGELFQHLDHSVPIPTTWGGAVLLCKPARARKRDTCCF